MTVINTITLLVCLSAVFSYLNHRFLKLPMAIGLMALSLGLSLLLIVLGALGFKIEAEVIAFIKTIDFYETLMHGMLSFLLFAGALHFNVHDLLDQKLFIGTLASVGVLVSTIIVGVLSYYVFNWLGVDLPLLYCFLFGALISPTDPIAVLGILRSAGVPKPLEIKITGESLFNDGVGVVVFVVLLGVANHGLVSPGSIGLLFLQEAVGGAIIGLALGLVGYHMLKSVDNYQVEVLLTLSLVMGGYTLAQGLHTSGPIAVVVAGLVVGSYARHFAMSKTSREYLDTFWQLVDELLNAILFVLIGLEILTLSVQGHYLLAGLLAIPIVLLARFLSVGLPVKLFSYRQDFTRKATTIMTWSGLRGGISVAMALSLPAGSGRDAILTITYTVVVFSILVQGLTIGKLVQSATRNTMLSHDA